MHFHDMIFSLGVTIEPFISTDLDVHPERHINRIKVFTHCTVSYTHLVFMTLEIYCIKVFGGIKLSILDIKNLVLNIKTGISLLLGNLASVLIVSIDRWCIQIFLTLKDFSYYSFAVSIENLFNICVSAITIAFYSY